MVNTRGNNITGLINEIYLCLLQLLGKQHRNFSSLTRLAGLYDAIEVVLHAADSAVPVLSVVSN